MQFDRHTTQASGDSLPWISSHTLDKSLSLRNASVVWLLRTRANQSVGRDVSMRDAGQGIEMLRGTMQPGGV